MAGPNIPNLPASLPADQVSFFTALKSSLEVLTGQGRNPDDTRALLVQELASLGINTNQFLNSSSIKPYAVVSSSSGSQKVPEAPKGLTVTKGPFVHKLEWSNPSDSIVSHIEVWVAEESQDRDDALLEGIHTVTKDLRGGTGKYNNAIFDVTHDFCYWIRSISYAGKHSEWYPGEIAGGYIVTGADSVQETIDQVMDILQGQLTEDELYTDLKSRINLIDATGTGLVDRVSTIEANIDSMDNWVSGTAYEEEDVVAYDDKIYLCILDTVSPHTELPTNTTYWEKIGESASLAGNIAANATAIDLLDARVEDNEDDVVAHATLLSDLRSDVDDNGAAITSEATTRATADSTNASNITTVSTQVNHATTGLPATYATVQTNATSIDGIKAKYAVKLDVNGHITGIELISNGTTGEFGILADKFKVFLPDGTGSAIQAFVLGLVDEVATVGIDGSLVVDETILARSILTGSLTVEKIAEAQTFIGHTFQSSNYEEGVSGWELSPLSGKFHDVLMTFSSSGLTDAQTALNIADGATNDADIRMTGKTTIDGGLLDVDSEITVGDTAVVNGNKYVLISGSTGEVSLYRCISGAFRKAKTLQNYDSGSCENGTLVYINKDYWDSAPDVQVFNKNIMHYHKDYPGQSQSVICSYTDLEEYETGHWRFMPLIQLYYGAGWAPTLFFGTETGDEADLSCQQNISGTSTVLTASWTTPETCTELLIRWLCTASAVYGSATTTAKIYVDGNLKDTQTAYKYDSAFEYPAVPTVNNVITTVTGLSNTTHTVTITLSMAYAGNIFWQGTAVIDEIDQYLDDDTQLSGGTGAWIAQEIE